MTELIVWHDGACSLCRREIALMRRLDRRASRCRPASTRSRTGGCCPGAAAFAAMWRAVPPLRPLGLAARDARVLALLEWTYLRFLFAWLTLQRLANRL